MDNPVFEDNTVPLNESPLITTAAAAAVAAVAAAAAAAAAKSTITTTSTNTASTTSTTVKRNAVHLSHPVHVRSGSLPIEIGMGANANAGGISRKAADLYASHRFRVPKERPALQGYENLFFEMLLNRLY